jgi:hypothetical protein
VILLKACFLKITQCGSYRDTAKPAFQRTFPFVSVDFIKNPDESILEHIFSFHPVPRIAAANRKQPFSITLKQFLLSAGFIPNAAFYEVFFTHGSKGLAGNLKIRQVEKKKRCPAN